MSDSLSVDPEKLRASATRQRDIADRAMLLTAELKSAIERAGIAWGTDEPGKAFEKYYLPGSRQAVEALDRMVTALDTMSTGLTDSAASFEAGDIDMGRVVRRAAPDATDTARPGPAVGPGRIYGPGSEWMAPVGDRGLEPAGSVVGEQPGRRSTPDMVPPEAGPTSGNPVSGESASTGAPRSGGSPQPPTPRSDSPPPPGIASGPQDIPGARTHPGPRSVLSGDTDAAGPPNRSATTAAGSRPDMFTAARPGRTPWSGGTSSGRGISAPVSPNAPRGPVEEPPPRPSAPRTGQPPNTGKAAGPTRQPSVKRAANAAKSSPPRTVDASPRVVRTEPEVLRIAGEMATRHGLALVGFDTAGVDEPTVRELAAALDDVLTGHRILDLRVVEIAEMAGGEPACTRWERILGVDGSAACAVRLILNRARPTAPRRSDSDGPAWAPETTVPESPAGRIYTVVVRELGRALDALGEHNAQRKVQRALIQHFLGVVAPDYRHRSLGRLVYDYRQWRDALAGAGGAGRFDPESVLVEAFVEVVSGAGRAGETAGVLHRLLVDAARRAG
ncbi:WXG100 family type VII secretion target [Nocardia brevicatena]|uniref:WXG100 family type VII secretion target n=1 Tax=Nocardia brevicatena TaxID=37327 RepID=UPI0003181045|nr:WXG100 family type VII secretion target [Nocardia brevicatena]